MVPPLHASDFWHCLIGLTVPLGKRRHDEHRVVCHVFTPDVVHALRTAVRLGRPLLIRGEPGVGKSQIASAAAFVLRRPLATHVVNSRTEACDLCFHFDAVKRLALAQMLGALASAHKQLSHEDLMSQLDMSHFISPGALWWAFDWRSAALQAETNKRPWPARFSYEQAPGDWVISDESNGVVVLIDEIDKGEPDLPNGLLEPLAELRFSAEGYQHPDRRDGAESSTIHLAGHAPLIIITTNEERELPRAFIRRCVVLKLDLPSEAELHARATAQFGPSPELLTPHGRTMMYHQVYQWLMDARKAVENRPGAPKPGQAEYLDCIEALRGYAPEDQPEAIGFIKQLVFEKHRGLSE